MELQIESSTFVRRERAESVDCNFVTRSMFQRWPSCLDPTDRFEGCLDTLLLSELDSQLHCNDQPQASPRSCFPSFEDTGSYPSCIILQSTGKSKVHAKSLSTGLSVVGWHRSESKESVRTKSLKNDPQSSTFAFDNLSRATDSSSWELCLSR